MKPVRSALPLCLVALCAACESSTPNEPWMPPPGGSTGDSFGPGDSSTGGSATGASGGGVDTTASTTAGSTSPPTTGTATSTGTTGTATSGSTAGTTADAGTQTPVDGGNATTGFSPGASSVDAATDGSEPDAEQPPAEAGTADSGPADETCALPTTFEWTGDGPLAQPKNGSVSMKDFTHVIHEGKHILYFTTFDSNWGSAMMTFDDWSSAADAPQHPTAFGVAPTLFYFTPKGLWVLAYQWGRHKFSYRTSSDPTNPRGWSEERSLYDTALPPNGTGPIDQTVICDSARCFLYYAGDNGHIYKSSMPIDDFPGEFPGAVDSGIVGTTQNLFEGVQVYKVQGSDTYLMIVEAQGSPGRYFRAWTSTDLEGPWNHLTDEFAIKKNVALTPDWTDDISHGDIVRENPDETFTIDPCNLQMVFQGRDPRIHTSYGRLPYRLGLITHAP